MSSEPESTQYLSTQSDDWEGFDCDNEMNSILSNFNMDDLMKNPSAKSNDFFGDLSSEFQVNNVDSPLKDLI